MSLIIGISGGSGSGKTSFVKALDKSFASNQITLLSQDDYYKSKEKQKIDENGVINFDLPRSIHLKQFAEDIKKLCQGKVVTRMEYTFNNDKKAAKKLVFNPAPIILVEGLFIFHSKKINALLDLSVLIQAKVSDKIIRRILRDKIERNYPLDDVLYRYKNHVVPAYEKYIAPYQNSVDLIVNNNVSFDKGLAVLKAYINEYLSTN